MADGMVSSLNMNQASFPVSKKANVRIQQVNARVLHVLRKKGFLNKRTERKCAQSRCVHIDVAAAAAHWTEGLLLHLGHSAQPPRNAG